MAESREAKASKDKYRKVKKLGTGAYGSAYLVESLITHKLWVIKKVDLNDMTLEERNKARDEARILEVLNHPNIIRFKDVFKDKKLNLNVVMEYADDCELAQKIMLCRKTANYMDEEQILDYFTQICLGLKHCHDRKIMHRDLKPGNVFLTRRGMVKLGDFGISRVLQGTKSKAQSIVGTPIYLAPEILKDQPYNQKTDIWALGVLLYEMAALQPPFKENDLVRLGQLICRGKYPPLPENYSHAFKNIVQLCLQKSPGARPNIHSILNLPIIKKRIKNYLQADVFKEEFAHTLLHNQNVFEEFKKMRAKLENGEDGSHAAATQEETNTAPQTDLFHPPESFLTNGGSEAQYKEELGNIYSGISLDESTELATEEVEPDGVDLDMSNANMANSSSESMQIVTQLEPERMSEITSMWERFQPYMCQSFGEDIFNQGYEIVRQFRLSAFGQDSDEPLVEQLTEIIPNEVLRKDFINLCLTQLLASQLDHGAFVWNVNEETAPMLSMVPIDDGVEDL